MPPGGVGDAGLVEIEALDDGRAAGGDQQVRSFQAFAVLEDHRHACRAALDPRDLDVAAQIDAFALQARHDDGGELGIVLGEEVGDLQHRDPRAQPAMGLGQLQADRPAADHDQMARAGCGWRRSSRW